jgi:hypothetical protein
MSSKKVGVFGIFSTRIAVDNAMDSLVRAGFATSDISVLLPESLGESKNMGTEKETKAPEGTTVGVTASVSDLPILVKACIESETIRGNGAVKDVSVVTGNPLSAAS